MLNKLRQKFSDLTKPTEIHFLSRSLAEPHAKWEEKSELNIESLLSYIAFFTTHDGGQPWGFKLNDLDLGNTDLSGIEDRYNLRSHNGKFVLLGDCSFTRVNFSQSQASGVYFMGSHFDTCNFKASDLTAADFRSKKTYYFSFMMNPVRQQYKFGVTKFDNVSFASALLKDAKFEGAILNNVDFTNADLRGADFSNVDIRRCIFDHALIEGATFSRRFATPELFENTQGRPNMVSMMTAAQMATLKRLRRPPTP